ncbi:hypothetical protein AOQ84DRAFT_392308 [Glonium stellatum]|uniref:Polyketide synthase n=1 Tax=Glonium stellatum TaxID=574774 RepID=A0A8E2ERC3_9PEZI|nr:hypothetical protein AOQ84DRAFT_392308 [Glonium stellatum]
MAAVPSLIAFGSLASWPAPDQVQQLRNALRQQTSLRPIVEAIHDLASLWEALAASEPSLDVVDGKLAADQLAQWIAGVNGVQIVNEKRNVLTMPMTVVAQMVQYFSYLQQPGGVIGHRSILESVAAGGGIQGFCAGLLSALAVASGVSVEEVGRSAATSLRLAFCIGAYIDRDQSLEGSSKTSTLAVRWKPPTTLQDIQSVLLNYPDTYIAVVRDVRDVTITTPTSAVTTLRQHLSSTGISVLDIGLSGRYHASVHKDVPAKILDVCHERFSPRFGNQHLVRSNTNGQIIPSDNAVLVALQCILVDHADWYSTISTAASILTQVPGNPFILSIGTDAVPQSVARSFPVIKVTAIGSKANDMFEAAITAFRPGPGSPVDGRYPENAIAIIGMACKFPGADSIDEFWSLLTEGRSMLGQMPEERFPINDLPRSNSGLRFWGNFVRDIDAFDHKFFKRSAREAASMDPQQRLLLQVAYEALESSGYFADPSRPQDIGCYLGSCSTDYDNNVASHPATAYSTIGTLRAFLSGKLSHFFGWSGPSLTFDTACSSSAVAIHTACAALRTGECSQAMAGGVTLLTSPYLYENLSAAHFLSPSGATKPFDASADGYCRGEGVGLVVLKRLSDAIANNDVILGVIAGSAVNQNKNCVPITVPHSPSQSNLYQRVADQAGIAPNEVTFVEAHGTGTPVGDPIEMESIRHAFGGPKRTAPLFVSSVKGNIGHLEGASGIAALIKAVLQMEYRTACTQASFKSLNPKIPALEPDNMCIPTSNRALSGDLLTACVNNYGAAGSNAAMMLIEAPRKQKPHSQGLDLAVRPRRCKYPIQIAAASVTSLLAYCTSLDDFCRKSLLSRNGSQQLLPSLAFNLARQQNQELAHVLTLSASNIDELQSQLRLQTPTSNAIKQRPKDLPVVLCFGGQVNDYVALSKDLWQQSSLLRSHLDLCDEISRSVGHPGLYPGIFQTESVTDVVALHTMVFATQYACAQAWLDSGLKVDALIGHSLGQITALCVSGMLSLRDGLRLIAGRASLMREHWGPESGTMIAVEADQQSIEEITNMITTADARHQFEVACYNGPTSHVVVSDKASADELEVQIVKRSIRYKGLNVPYGFHSRFTDPLLPHLEHLASSLIFHEAKIPLETCTDKIGWSKPTPQLIAAHTRDPVFFGQAVQRLRDKLGTCTWLEAGSDSSVVGMVRRALGHSPDTPDNFLPMQLSKPNSPDLLVDATLNLWNRGHKLQFWNFHRSQTPDYDVLRLPSYKFDQPKHWLKLNTAAPADANPEASGSQGDAAIPTLPAVLIRFASTDSQGKHFDVDSRSDEYQTLVKGHVVLGSALCPSALYVELASRAVSIAEEIKPTYLLSVQDLQIESPLGLAADRNINIHLQSLGDAWVFKVTSGPGSLNGSKHATAVCHATGVVSLHAPNRTLQEEFLRYERLISHNKIGAVLDDKESESVQGAMVYKVFSKVVYYADCYRGVKSIAARDCQVVGKVVPPKHIPESIRDSTVHPHVLDSFVQVASLYANCIYDCSEDEVFWLDKVDRIQLGPDFKPHGDESFAEATWDVLAFASTGDGGVANDIFIYHAATGRLALLMLGARFRKACRASLTEILLRADEAPANVMAISKNTDTTRIAPQLSNTTHISNSPAVSPPHAKPSQLVKNNEAVIYDDICVLLEKIADLPRDEIRGNASFDDIGVDSLMMIEVMNEISTLFHTDLPLDDLEKLTDINSLTQYLHRRGCMGSAHADTNSSSYASSSASTSASSPSASLSSSGVTTPPATPSANRVAEKLSKLVVEHLEMEAELTLATNLADQGLDSLLCIELASDIKKNFSVEIDMEKLDHDSTFGDLLNMVLEDGDTSMITVAKFGALSTTPGDNQLGDALSTTARTENAAADVQAEHLVLRDSQECFEKIRLDFDRHAEQTHFKDFWNVVYPKQAELVVAYTVEAFRKLGCDLAELVSGQQLSLIHVLPKHGHLLERLHKILVDGSLIKHQSDHTYARTTKPIDPTPAATLFEQMLQHYPWHASESKLLNVTGSRLAECLTGQMDPLQLLFANKANRDILADVYDNAPMCQATTRLLADFLAQIFSASQSDGVFRILEVGAGTGGTARYLIDFLTRRGIKFEYTFTDISSALVTAAKKKFAGRDAMKFMTLDCDRVAPPELCNKFHAVIATNCIHATTNATASAANIAPLLRDDGAFCLVEFTRGLYWFDLVYGLLEGWWLFSDGRQHALADEWFWNKTLRAAGYKHVSWTDGSTSEAETLRLICAFKGEVEKDCYTPVPRTLPKRAGIPMETFVWKQIGSLQLQADIYYPKNSDHPAKKRPIALMVHGGGHLLYSRKDMPMKHVRVLLQRGVLPVSVDYRLCPEVNLFDGPVTDVCDALRWVRETLPSLQLGGPSVRVDPEKVLALGWSSGGQLAMSLGYTASPRGIKPPDAILAFYSPTDLEAEHWDQPIFPSAAEEEPTEIWGILDGVRDEPILEYTPMNNKKNTALSLTLKDDRARIILHMNWKAQSVPILIHGLPNRNKLPAGDETDWKALPKPSLEKVRAVSPYWQIIEGNYRTPTFMVHGNRDDWIPWQMSQRTIEALQARGIPAGLEIPDGCGHAFDLFTAEDRLGVGWAAVDSAYDFVCRQLSLAS